MHVGLKLINMPQIIQQKKLQENLLKMLRNT
jgi:hypothetical protein